MTINRQLPGPSIHVCQGDLVVVDVINMMGGTRFVDFLYKIM